MSEPKKRPARDPNRKAPPPPAETHNSSGQGESITASHDGSPDADDLRFLAPPQRADEIGRLNGYRILRKLGEGGMGLVFEAEDTDLNRRVALKVMRPDVARVASNRARFLREAKAAAAVEHANIVPIFRVGEENGVPFIAMPFLKGEPLDARLRRSRLSVAEIVAVGSQTASGLAAAHERGMVHRDIKPANVWLSAGAERPVEVKILDFGLARQSEEDVRLTRTGAVLGTPAYMAPEQAASQEVDSRADLFSLGAMLYEMATGLRPFKGNSFVAILANLALETPPDPASLNTDLPPALARLIMKLLEKDPARRPQSASEVVEAFRQMSSGATVTAVPRTRAAASRPAKPPLRLLLVGGAMVAAGVVAVAVFILASNKTPPTSGVAQADSTKQGDLVGVAPTDPAKVVPDPQTPTQPPKGDPPKAEDNLTFDLGNGINLELVRIDAKGKKFLMGSPKDEPERSVLRWRKDGQFDSELQHEVSFRRDWYMGKYEVTQEQYEAVVGSNPSWGEKGPKRPVENLTWDDAQAFVKKLNEKFKDRKVRFRLPSEAEWEYACRAGTTTPFVFGKTLTPQQAHMGSNSGSVTTKPVGSYSANPFGLHDMHGNVSEWCEDYFGEYEKAPTDGTPQTIKPEWQVSPLRIVRGGGFWHPAHECRSAFRVWNKNQETGNRHTGFRLACDQE